MVKVKIETIKNRVDTLTKIDLANLDFGGINKNNKSSNIHKDILQITRDLNRFTRNLKTAEKQYTSNHVNQEVVSSFGKLVDLYHGDDHRALDAMNIIIDNIMDHVKSDPTASNKTSKPSSNTDTQDLPNIENQIPPNKE